MKRHITTANDEIVNAFLNRKDLRAEWKQIEKDIIALHKREEELGLMLDEIDKVTHIIDGVALNIDGASVEPVSEEENSRWTESNENVRDGGINLRFRIWRETGGYDDVGFAMGVGPRIARKLAVAYVLYDEIPEQYARRRRSAP